MRGTIMRLFPLVLRRFGIALALLAAAALGAEETPKSDPRPVASLGWLVGGVWTADASKLGPGMKRIETRYQWADNGAFIRFTTHFVTEKGTLKNYDGNFFWNPEQSALAIWYMDAGNEIIQGPVKLEGDTMRVSFRANDFQGRPADLRVEVVRATNDRYTWRLAEKTGDDWKALAALEYVRIPGS